VPQCEDECVAGFVWDKNLKACRKPKRCTDLACPTSQSCIEATDSADAQCQGARCSNGQGYDSQNDQCRTCFNGFSPVCNGDGETGNVIVTESKDGADCVCETQDGYYLGEGNAALPCDADGDGWVSDSAQPSIEGSNAILRTNARCHVRRVGSVVLQNEAGDAYTAEDFSNQFGSSSLHIPKGLPLYESARNDGAPSHNDLPKYPGRSLLAEEVNSLTKGCAPDPTSDFNDNGVADVHEWSGHTIKLDNDRGASSSLTAYYGKYTRFSYFLELNDGFFQPDAQDKSTGIYYIRERLREEGDTKTITSADVPVLYKSNVAGASASPNYAQQCVRHVDAVYGWKGDSAPYEPGAATSAGGDFGEFGDDGGMTHHSQYKCVLALSSDDYLKYNGGSTATETKSPEVATPDSTDSTLLRLGSTLLTPNACEATDVKDASAPSADANSLLPGFTCVPASATDVIGQAVLAAVNFDNVSQASPYKDVSHPGGYRRGCINQCLDASVFSRTNWPVCQKCVVDANGFGAGRYENKPVGATPCTETDPNASGVCNGHGTCGVCVPGTTSCSGTAHLTCQPNGQFFNDGVLSGACGAECSPSATRACDPCGSQSCDSGGHWGPCPATTLTWFYPDADADGYGDVSSGVQSCDQPPGYSKDFSDCDDSRSSRHPGSPEVCGDGIDNDCNGFCDDGCLELVHEKPLCRNDDLFGCDDILLTADLSENYPGISTTSHVDFFTYIDPIPGVTTSEPLLRCVLPSGVHYVTMGLGNCYSLESTWGYPLANPGPNRINMLDCYQSGNGGQIEMTQFGASCTGTPINAAGPWLTWSEIFGFTPYGQYSSPPTSCWGQ